MSDIRLRLLSANFEENFEHTHQLGAIFMGIPHLVIAELAQDSA